MLCESERTKQPEGDKLSSRARYDRFDTSPFRKYSVFGTDNMISSQARYDHFDTLPNIQPYYSTEFPVKSQEQNAAERGEKEKRIFDMVGMNFVIAGSGGNLLY